jgi:hypothetical protein
MLYFMKFKDLMCNFCGYCNFLFLSQFSPDLDENYIKIYLKCRATRLLSRFNPKPVLTSPKTTVLTGLTLNESERPGPVLRSYVVLRTGP